MALISIKVFRALLCSGSLNKATESEIASSPVKDALPLANAFKIKRIAAKLNNPCGSPSGSKPSLSVGYVGRLPVKFRYKPKRKTVNIAIINK